MGWTQNLARVGHNQSVQRWVTGWTAGVSFSEGQEIFLYCTESRSTPQLIQPSIQWVPGARFLGVKRTELEADQSPQPNAEVKNGGAIPPLPHRASRRRVELYLTCL
jgi:hypothetical protein